MNLLRRHRSALVAAAAALAILASAGRAPAQGEAARAADSHEPTVSREEAKLLREVEDLARTDPARAIEALRRGITEGSSPALDFALGTLLHQQGETRPAADAFRRAVGKMPQFDRARENLARVLLVLDDYDAAARELSILVEGATPSKGEIWKLLGFARLAGGEPVAAETAYRNALVRLPKDREIRMGLIQALLDQERLEAVRPLLERELADAPDDGEVWSLLANVDLASGRPRDALVRLECARRLGVASSEAKLALGDLLLSEGLFEEALERFRECAGLAEASTSRLLGAVEGLVALGRVEEARELLGELDRPDRAWIAEDRRRRVFAEAKLAEAEGRPNDALERYREFLAQDPLDGEALLAAARIRRERGDLEEARILYERASRASPDLRADALLGLAQIAVEREEWQVAVDLLEESLDLRRRPYVERYLEEVRRRLR